MPDFLKEHPIVAPVAVLGGVLAVFGTINDAYSLVEVGLPNQVWTAIGLTVFFVSTAAIVVRLHSEIQRTLAVADGGKETGNWLSLFKERETLEQQVLKLKAKRPGISIKPALKVGMDEDDVREEEIKRKERRIIELTSMLGNLSSTKK